MGSVDHVAAQLEHVDQGVLQGRVGVVCCLPVGRIARVPPERLADQRARLVERLTGPSLLAQTMKDGDVIDGRPRPQRGLLGRVEEERLRILQVVLGPGVAHDQVGEPVRGNRVPRRRVGVRCEPQGLLEFLTRALATAEPLGVARADHRDPDPFMPRRGCHGLNVAHRARWQGQRLDGVQATTPRDDRAMSTHLTRAETCTGRPARPACANPLRSPDFDHHHDHHFPVTARDGPTHLKGVGAPSFRQLAYRGGGAERLGKLTLYR